MRTECQERRKFLRVTLAIFGGLLVAKSIGLPVWAAYRPASQKTDRGNASFMQTTSESRSTRFDEDEETLLAALVDLIFPNDGNGPSAKEIDVAHALSESASVSSHRLLSYRVGLARIQALSQALYGKKFTDLPQRDRYHLLAYLDEAKANIEQNAATLKDKLVRKWRYVYYTWRGVLQTADFWMTLRSDSVAVYYSHEFTWKWLGYSGPPFPNGYAADLSA